MPPDLTRAISLYRHTVEQIKAMFPEETEDSLADTIEGCTVIDEVIVTVLRNAIEREAHAEAIGDMIATMTAKQRRLVDGAQRLRKAALDAMQEVGLPKINAPDLTATVGAGRPKVLIIDEATIPDIYIRVKREPDKKAIGDVLKSGHAVPGASLSNATPVLFIRRT